MIRSVAGNDIKSLRADQIHKPAVPPYLQGTTSRTPDTPRTHRVSSGKQHHIFTEPRHGLLHTLKSLDGTVPTNSSIALEDGSVQAQTPLDPCTGN